jgi:hypothetical protein
LPPARRWRSRSSLDGCRPVGDARPLDTRPYDRGADPGALPADAYFSGGGSISLAPQTRSQSAAGRAVAETYAESAVFVIDMPYAAIQLVNAITEDVDEKKSAHNKS